MAFGFPQRGPHTLALKHYEALLSVVNAASEDFHLGFGTRLIGAAELEHSFSDDSTAICGTSMGHRRISVCSNGNANSDGTPTLHLRQPLLDGNADCDLNSNTTSTATPTPTATATAIPTGNAYTHTRADHLTARGYKVQGRRRWTFLEWSYLEQHDIYRNGVLIATVPNISGYTDHIGARGKAATLQGLRSGHSKLL